MQNFSLNTAKVLSNLFVSTILVALLGTFVPLYLSIWMGWFTWENITTMEVFAVMTSYACTWLTVKQSRWNYPIAVVTTILYVFVFLNASPPLVGSALTNIYLPIALYYGWRRWGPDGQTRAVAHLKWDWSLLGYVAVTALGIGAVFLALHKFNAEIPPQEAAILGLTILAQFLLDNKKIETWIVWAVINVIAIYTYFNGGLMLAGIQYVLFLANTLYGWYEWNKSIGKDINPSKIFVERGVSPQEGN